MAGVGVGRHTVASQLLSFAVDSSPELAVWVDGVVGEMPVSSRRSVVAGVDGCWS